MIAGLGPYPAMKDSGVPWLGAVPSDWNVQRIKRLFREKDERSGDGNGLLLSLTRARGLLPQAEASNRLASAPDLSKYKVCRPGELVMNRMQAWSGMFAVSEYEGLVSPDYSVFAATERFELRFFEQLFKTPLVVDQFAQASKGVGSGFNRLYTPEFGAIPVAFPPLPEQAAIVRFLDHADRRIRRYIGAKQKLIKLLQEQKQAIIHRAVTRGLDPNVRLKPSGVEWLGDVPEHWEERPAKWFFREVDERSASGDEELLSVSHLTGVTPRSQKSVTMFMAESYVGHKVCRSGDLVINTMWAWMAALGVARQVGLVSPGYGVYRPRRGSPLIGDYADLLLRTRPYVSEYVCRSTGIQSSRLRLYPEQFLRIPVVCPPEAEQRAILESVGSGTAEMAKAIAAALREIQLLQEYRTRLIADVVTGKLDVREAAARLPEDGEEPESLDVTETLGEAEEESSPNDLDAEPEEAEA
ncbi:MAG: hypothetical protein V5B60_16915 [Accumulibacter sp.]|jgi:type I restriction enzyme S subunit|uniref:restriction endonuclease subunit S n=1 Tax=Accumulibacter sp. TaxID=2053492 RepID=UPI002FC2F5BB